MSDPELERILSERMRRLAGEGGAVGKSSSMVRLTESTFDQYARGEQPLFVDFWAEWCGPCRATEPVVEKMAKIFAGKVTIGKLNVDEETSVATRYEVFSIPTFMIFKKGNPVDVLIGAVGESAIEKFIQKATSDPPIYR